MVKEEIELLDDLCSQFVSLSFRNCQRGRMVFLTIRVGCCGVSWRSRAIAMLRCDTVPTFMLRNRSRAGPPMAVESASPRNAESTELNTWSLPPAHGIEAHSETRGKLRVTRLSLGWFAPKDPASFSVEKFPIWLHGAHYGFPVLPDFPGFKVAKHWGGDPTDPDKVDRVPNESDEKLVRDYLSVHLPLANGSVLAFKVCMYTNGGPWLGPLPGEKRVTFIAACNAIATRRRK